MSKFLRLALVPLMLLALSGCQMFAKTVHCDDCNSDVPVGTYCTKNQTLMGQQGTVHCDKCNKDMPTGKYCAKCNRIMLPGTVKCACGMEMPKGSYCGGCKAYVGVPNVVYCPACKAPHDKSKDCAGCSTPCAKACKTAAAKPCNQ